MFLEYFMSFGILLSFFAFLLGILLDRRSIIKVLKKNGIGKTQVLAALLIMILFIALELSIVKPTQQLFFDDAIYQGMAVDFIHMGQALMCDYGTPTTCYIGEMFHEPIGTPFNFAIAFLLFGVHRIVAYGDEFFLATISVLMSFFATSLMMKNNKIGYFAELFMALSPIMLVWAFPTTSDMPTLAYSLVAFFFLLIFINNKSKLSFSNMLFSLAILTYMKVEAVLYIPLFFVIYLLLDDKSIINSIKNNYSLIKNNMLNTKALLVLLVFVIAVMPELLYVAYEHANGNYGATMIQNTCSKAMLPMNYTGAITFANFKYNFCANVDFWFNKYSDVYIMQPLIYTLFAIIGFLFMIFYKQKNELIAMVMWFITFFVLYTAFYAGAVIYGVDWRFMLALIYQACFFSGVGAGYLYELIGKILRIRKLSKKLRGTFAILGLTILFATIFYPLYALEPLLAIKPSAILQAGSARFDENFVYTNISAIPSNCLVFSYVPYLFNINGRAGAQMFYLFNDTFMANAEKNYSCLVIDYGYWCKTPNNICVPAMADYNTTPLKTATYYRGFYNFTFGFYRIVGKR